MEITLFGREKGKVRVLVYLISTKFTHNFCKESLSSELRIVLTLKAGASSFENNVKFESRCHFTCP